MKLETLKANIKEARKKCAALEVKRDESSARAKAAREAAQTAAADGDVDEYVKQSEAAKKFEAAEFVAQAQINKVGDGFTPADVANAWKDYADDYNRELSKKMDAFQKTRAQLCKQYFDLVEAQDAALKERKFCGDLLGLDEGSREVEQQLPMETIPARNGIRQDAGARLLNRVTNYTPTPEESYFMAVGDIKDVAEAERLHRCIRMHRTV